jgi:hypothetical protein
MKNKSLKFTNNVNLNLILDLKSYFFIIRSSILMLNLILLFNFPVKADIIPPHHHRVFRCIKITNLNQFSQIKMIGLITGPVMERFQAYVVNENDCLNKGYKFNQLSLYWVKKDYLESINLSSLKVTGRKIDDPQFKFLSNELNPGDIFVPNTDPTREEYFFYELNKDQSSEYALKLIKHIKQ